MNLLSCTKKSYLHISKFLGCTINTLSVSQKLSGSELPGNVWSCRADRDKNYSW